MGRTVEGKFQNRFIPIKTKTPIFFAAAVLSYFLSFPPYGTGLLAFVCLVPLFSILAGKPKKSAFFGFFIFSFFSYMLLLYWIPRVMVKYGDTSLFLGVTALIVLAAFLSLFSGAAGVLIGNALVKSSWHASTVAAIWVVKDLVIEKVFSGFPWCLLGYSQYKHALLGQWAEVGGIHLISSLLVAVNCLLYFFIRKRKKETFLFLVGFLFILEAGGFLLLKRQEERQRLLPFHRAGIVQPNVSYDIRFDYLSSRRKLEFLLEKSKELQEKGCEFVVWPEYTVPLYPLQDPTVLNRFQEFTSGQIPIFAGFTDLQNEKVFNAILLFEGSTLSQYNKVHLTPFGEYIPFRRLLFFVKKITDEISDFTPGSSLNNLVLHGHPHATPICYEIIYPQLVRGFVHKGAAAIINISNDSWFGRTSAPHQHLAMATFRAIENRRYILRSTSNGISALISPTGRILKSAPTGKEDYFTASFQYDFKYTFFTRMGFLFPYFCCAFLVFLLAFSLGKKVIRTRKNAAK